MLNIKRWMTIGLLTFTAPLALASTASFSSANNSLDNEFKVTASDGTKITVTGWSDTNGRNDDVIQAASSIDRYGNGWGITNQDGESGSPEHSADNRTHSSSDRWTDYDFFMLAFDKDVTLAGANFSWIWGNTSSTQVSVVALDNTAVAGNGGDIDGLTWNSVNSSYALGSGYSQMQNDSGYYINANVNESSSYWLVGAFNSVFGGNGSMKGDDGFKLAGINFSAPSKPDTKISEPSTIAVLSIALIALISNRRKKV